MCFVGAFSKCAHICVFVCKKKLVYIYSMIFIHDCIVGDAPPVRTSLIPSHSIHPSHLLFHCSLITISLMCTFCSSSPTIVLPHHIPLLRLLCLHLPSPRAELLRSGSAQISLHQDGGNERRRASVPLLRGFRLGTKILS